jgi:hypothetical protein
MQQTASGAKTWRPCPEVVQIRTLMQPESQHLTLWTIFLKITIVQIITFASARNCPDCRLELNLTSDDQVFCIFDTQLPSALAAGKSGAG